jgi:hypothetical protein
LKDREKRIEQDSIWKNICQELNWEFIPTVWCKDYLLSNPMAFLWKDYPHTVKLFKSGSAIPLELTEGDFILTNLYPDGIKIVKFYGVIT